MLDKLEIEFSCGKLLDYPLVPCLRFLQGFVFFLVVDVIYALHVACFITPENLRNILRLSCRIQ